MKHNPEQPIDLFEIEREARRLRAEEVRRQFSALGAWFRGRPRVAGGKTA